MQTMLRGSRRIGPSCVACLDEAPGTLASALNPTLESHGSSISDSSRDISTSASTPVSKGFQSILKKSVPKSQLLNLDNLQEWRSSKYSLSGADGILNKQHQGSASVKAAELTKRLLQLLKDAESLASLKLVVQGLRLHMTPTVLVEAIAKVPRTSEDTARGKPQVTKEQLLDLLLPLLQPHIATLTTHRLIMVAGSLSFAKYTPSPEVGGALLKQFAGPSGASRLRDASVGDLVHLIMSAPFLGWDSLDLWDRFSRAAKDRLKAMNAAQLAGALRAMCGMDARSVHAKAFWAQAREEVGMRHKELAKDEAVALAAMLKCISAAATAGLGDGSSLLAQGFKALSPNVGTLPPKALANLLWATALNKTGGQKARLDLVADAAAHTVTNFTTPQLSSAMEALVKAEHAHAPLTQLSADILKIRGLAARQPHPDPLTTWRAGEELAEAPHAASLAHALAVSGCEADHKVWMTLAWQAAAAKPGADLALSTILHLLRAFHVAEAAGAAMKLAGALSPTLAEHGSSLPQDMLVSSLPAVAWTRWQQGPPPGPDGELVADPDQSKAAARDMAHTDAALKTMAARLTDLDISTFSSGQLLGVQESLDYGHLPGHKLHEWLQNTSKGQETVTEGDVQKL